MCPPVEPGDGRTYSFSWYTAPQLAAHCMTVDGFLVVKSTASPRVCGSLGGCASDVDVTRRFSPAHWAVHRNNASTRGDGFGTPGFNVYPSGSGGNPAYCQQSCVPQATCIRLLFGSVVGSLPPPISLKRYQNYFADAKPLGDTQSLRSLCPQALSADWDTVRSRKVTRAHPTESPLFWRCSISKTLHRYAFRVRNANTRPPISSSATEKYQTNPLQSGLLLSYVHSSATLVAQMRISHGVGFRMASCPGS